MERQRLISGAADPVHRLAGAQACVEMHGAEWVKKENIASNGAFMLDEYLPNTHVKLIKINFYDAANVSIDAHVLPWRRSRPGAEAVRAGEVDVSTDFASDQIKWLKENMPDQTRIAPISGSTTS